MNILGPRYSAKDLREQARIFQKNAKDLLDAADMLDHLKFNAKSVRK